MSLIDPQAKRIRTDQYPNQDEPDGDKWGWPLPGKSNLPDTGVNQLPGNELEHGAADGSCSAQRLTCCANDLQVLPALSPDGLPG